MEDRDKVLVVQPDKTILVDIHHPQFEEVRKKIILFSELIKTPEHVHFYRITPISLWNSAANGVPLEEILYTLEKYKKYEIPKNVIDYITKHYSMYGKVVLEKEGNVLILKVISEEIRERVFNIIEKFVIEERDSGFVIENENRGAIKTELVKHLIPVKDIAGYETGSKLDIEIRKITLENKEFAFRYYQSEAVYTFSKWREGSGIVILPCGAGKTIIALGIIADIKEYTLIITTSNESVKQWRKELLDKTTLKESDIGEYTSHSKDLKPVTITTYNMLIHKKQKGEEFSRNLNIFTNQNWGLIIYDEVHILPAPIFRMTTAIQSKRRLGLTATLVREDNLESEVFTLIGPKIYEYPWKMLEKEGWIAKAFCYEVKIPFPEELYSKYYSATQRMKFRLASENPEKIKVVSYLLEKHKNNHILIIGHFLSQLEEISRLFSIPLITGETLTKERHWIYEEFRKGNIKAICISRVGNFSIDLPLADVAIQISGIFGSRQEEAQRLGRILRPDTGKATFYTLISKDSVEEKFARKRQLFLLEQGYYYEIVELSKLINDSDFEKNNETSEKILVKTIS
ncbi:MAG: DNA repair helicase XPB [Brevinematia bacterium]